MSDQRTQITVEQLDPLSPNTPLVYVIILNYNGAQITLDCVRSVPNLDYPNFRVLVVDNASKDDSGVVLAEGIRAIDDSRIELLLNERNEGYAGGNNRGIDKALAAGAEYILALNNDIIAVPGSLAPLVDAMERDRTIGVCGCPIVNFGYESDPNLGQGISLYTGITSHWPHGRDTCQAVDVDYICGAAIMFRAEMLRQIGMFDARFFLLCEDSDICFRARKSGYRVCFVPGPGVRHHMSQTMSRHRPLTTFVATRNKVWFIRRHGTLAHRFVFNLLSFFYFYPKAILGRIFRRQFDLLQPLLRGIWEGHWKYPGSYARTARATQDLRG
jgi:hypothetical protein